MPIYDYICKDCEHELEMLQSISENPLVTCPSCHRDSLRKKITAPAFAFKGSGWYKDLYGSPSDKKTAAPNSKPEKSTPSKPAATKSSTKKEAKAS